MEPVTLTIAAGAIIVPGLIGQGADARRRRRAKQPPRPATCPTCSAHDLRWLSEQRAWMCMAGGHRFDADGHALSAHDSAPSQQDADLATLHRYFNAHPYPNIAVIPFEAWVGRVLAGESVTAIIDKAQGTIEADVLDDELRRLYSAQCNTLSGECTDEAWKRRTAPPESRAIRKRNCEREGHVAGRGETACRACGTTVQEPTQPYMPPGTPICQHGVQLPTNEHGGCLGCEAAASARWEPSPRELRPYAIAVIEPRAEVLTTFGGEHHAINTESASSYTRTQLREKCDEARAAYHEATDPDEKEDARRLHELFREARDELIRLQREWDRKHTSVTNRTQPLVDARAFLR